MCENVDGPRCWRHTFRNRERQLCSVAWAIFIKKDILNPDDWIPEECMLRVDYLFLCLSATIITAGAACTLRGNHWAYWRTYRFPAP